MEDSAPRLFNCSAVKPKKGGEFAAQKVNEKILLLLLQQQQQQLLQQQQQQLLMMMLLLSTQGAPRRGPPCLR